MKTALICFSDAGSALAIKLCSLFGWRKEDVHSIVKFADKYGFTAHEKIAADMGELFRANGALVFIGACGIAVRDIAPHLKSKTEDPAVLVIDDRGRYVIPILSGHIGGANALAKEIADKLGGGAIPVVTTATDGAGRFSCDAWAATHNCAISSMTAAKEVSARILTEDVPITAEAAFALPDPLPSGLIPGKDGGGAGIYIGTETARKGLRLIPRILTLGIGCRRGTPAEAIAEAVRETFVEAGIDPVSVERIASIDVKRDEAGLVEYALRIGVPLRFYTADELNAVEGSFQESEFVKKTVGVGNVCERAAVLGSTNETAAGRLVIGKTAKYGVTVAAAARDWRIEF
ncbi:MAG: cobalamin biosynthesis protein CbiG [Ruminococcaceae bacterium]|jgi:cobalt-precorrin 5A hydrolase|nr:cobalamin biosynthesis protein CbiG [Oscillospiraceae bacterium]